MASVAERLKAKGRKVEKVTCSDGDEFWIRSLSVRDNSDSFRLAYVDGKWDEVRFKSERFVRSVIEGENGGRAYSDKDVDQIADLEEYAVSEIMTAIDRLNTRGDAEKKPEVST